MKYCPRCDAPLLCKGSSGRGFTFACSRLGCGWSREVSGDAWRTPPAPRFAGGYATAWMREREGILEDLNREGPPEKWPL